MTAPTDLIAGTLRDLTALSLSLDHQIHLVADRAEVMQAEIGDDNPLLHFTLHGITAEGTGWLDAITAWQRAARRKLERTTA